MALGHRLLAGSRDLRRLFRMLQHPRQLVVEFRYVFVVKYRFLAMSEVSRDDMSRSLRQKRGSKIGNLPVPIGIPSATTNGHADFRRYQAAVVIRFRLVSGRRDSHSDQNGVDLLTEMMSDFAAIKHP